MELWALVVTSIFAFMLLGTTITMLHELGHYWAGRACGAPIKAYSVGFGPELIGYTDKRGTRWKLCPILLGGYVSFEGDMHPVTSDGKPGQGFGALARWKRAIIIVAGPVANLVTCGVLLFGLYAAYGVQRVSPVLQGVSAGSPAAESGLKAGDRIIRWNGSDMDGSQAIIRHIKASPGSPFQITIERAGVLEDKVIKLAAVDFVDRWGNKVRIGRAGLEFKTERLHEANPMRLASLAVSDSADMFRLQASTMWQLVIGLRPVQELSGPIRLAKAAGENFSLGWGDFTFFAAIFSLAVAFTNLVPIPGLDGGYLFIYAIETAIRRDLSAATYKHAIRFGLACVIALTIFVFANDISILFS